MKEGNCHIILCEVISNKLLERTFLLVPPFSNIWKISPGSYTWTLIASLFFFFLDTLRQIPRGKIKWEHDGIWAGRCFWKAIFMNLSFFFTLFLLEKLGLFNLPLRIQKLNILSFVSQIYGSLSHRRRQVLTGQIGAGRVLDLQTQETPLAAHRALPGVATPMLKWVYVGESLENIRIS